jgi:uncharacterized membrane protein YidH (DUF202 family)
MSNINITPAITPPTTPPITTKITKTIKSKIPAIIVGSLAFVAGLAWNEAIKGLIDYYAPNQYKNSKNAWIKVIYALILTIVIAIITGLIIAFGPDD